MTETTKRLAILTSSGRTPSPEIEETCSERKMSIRSASEHFGVPRTTLKRKVKEVRKMINPPNYQEANGKKKYRAWDPEDMQKAIQACLRGKMAIKDAVEAYNLPRSTLDCRMRAARAMNVSPEEVPVQYYMKPFKSDRKKATTNGQRRARKNTTSPVLSMENNVTDKVTINDEVIMVDDEAPSMNTSDEAPSVSDRVSLQDQSPRPGKEQRMRISKDILDPESVRARAQPDNRLSSGATNSVSTTQLPNGSIPHRDHQRSSLQVLSMENMFRDDAAEDMSVNDEVIMISDDTSMNTPDEAPSVSDRVSLQDQSTHPRKEQRMWTSRDILDPESIYARAQPDDRLSSGVTNSVLTTQLPDESIPHRDHRHFSLQNQSTRQGKEQRMWISTDIRDPESIHARALPDNRLSSEATNSASITQLPNGSIPYRDQRDLLHELIENMFTKGNVADKMTINDEVIMIDDGPTSMSTQGDAPSVSDRLSLQDKSTRPGKEQRMWFSKDVRDPESIHARTQQDNRLSSGATNSVPTPQLPSGSIPHRDHQRLPLQDSNLNIQDYIKSTLRRLVGERRLSDESENPKLEEPSRNHAPGENLVINPKFLQARMANKVSKNLPNGDVEFVPLQELGKCRDTNINVTEITKSIMRQKAASANAGNTISNRSSPNNNTVPSPSPAGGLHPAPIRSSPNGGWSPGPSRLPESSPNRSQHSTSNRSSPNSVQGSFNRLPSRSPSGSQYSLSNRSSPNIVPSGPSRVPQNSPDGIFRANGSPPSVQGGLNRIPSRSPNGGPNRVSNTTPDRIHHAVHGGKLEESTATINEISVRNIFTNTGANVYDMQSTDNGSDRGPGKVPSRIQGRDVVRKEYQNAERGQSMGSTPPPPPSQAPKEGHKVNLVLSSDQEMDMTNHIVNISSRLYGLDMEDIRRLAYEYADSFNLPKRFPDSYYGNKVNAQWAVGLALRNPPLQALNQNYAAGSSEKALMEGFFRKLRSIYKRKRILPDRIFNAEAFAINLTQRTEVVEKRGKQLRVMLSKPKNFASFQVCVNAKGDFMPPKLIIPSTPSNVNSILFSRLNNVSAEVEPTGLMTKKVFMKWFEEFVKFSQPTPACPVLLLLDARFEYIRTLQFFRAAKQLNVEILCFPPNLAHILQPLDVSFFAPMRHYYNQALLEHFKTNPTAVGDAGNSITGENLMRLFTACYVKAATKETGIYGFRNTGIYPLNPQQSILDFTAEDASPMTSQHTTSRPTEADNDSDSDDGFMCQIAAFAEQRQRHNQESNSSVAC